MSSGAMICVPSSIKTGPKVDMEDSEIHRQHGDLKSTLIFFQNKESRLKRLVVPRLV
jgi:hypothetical protein